MASEGSLEVGRYAALMSTLGLGADDPETIPTPWPELTELAELRYRRKVGIVAQRGSREAKVGRDTAVHAARAGIPTVLYTGYPPNQSPELLRLVETPNPTAGQVNSEAQRPIRGHKPRFIVIERYERLHPDPRPTSDVDEPVDDPEDPAPSWADRLVWSVRDIRVDVPMLLTTVVTPEPDISSHMSRWLHIDHPAMVMTDVCKPTLLVRRTGPTTVEARMEVDPDEYRNGERTLLNWVPLALGRP